MDFYLFVISNISKQISGDCAQKHLGHTERSTKDTYWNVLERPVQISSEATGDFISNKTEHKISSELKKKKH